MAPYLWLDHEQREIKMLESKQMSLRLSIRALLKANITPLNDNLGRDSAAPHLFSEEDDALHFLTKMSLSYLYSHISPARIYRANVDGWDQLRTCCVEEVAFPLGFGLLPESVAETLRLQGTLLSFR